MNYCIITFELSRIHNFRNCLSPSGMDNHHNSTTACGYQLGGLYGVSPVSHAMTDRRSVIVLRGADEKEEDDSAVDIVLRTATAAHIAKGFDVLFFHLYKLNAINEYKRMAYLYVKMTSSNDGKLV